MKEVEMPTSVNIVFGIPGETVKTMDESKDFLVSLDLTSKDYYAALATPYPGSPLFQHALEKGIIKDTREYLSDLGGYADYRYNLTDMPRMKFINKVIDVAYKVDCAYYKKRRQYRKIVSLVLEKYLKMTYYAIVSPETRGRIKLKSRLIGFAKTVFRVNNK